VSLEGVLGAMADVLRAMPEFRRVSNGPVDQVHEFPAGLLWFGGTAPGNLRAAAAEGGYLWVRQATLRVLVERNSDLPTEYARLVPFVDAIPAAFAARVTLGGLVDRCVPIGHSEPGQTQVAEQPCVTFDWWFEVKERVPGPFAG
jgi:hypothetical protein